MRLVKLSILGALLAIASSALFGSTASATTAELCQGHNGLSCTSNRVETTHLIAVTGTVVELLGVIDILCLSTLAEATASSQSLHATSLSFTGCGTGSGHNNCTVTIEELPSFNLLKTGLDEGTLTSTEGQIKLVCSNLGLNCLYDTEGLELSAGAQHITAEEAELTELGGKFFCPDASKLDALLESLETTYVLQAGPDTALCDENHEVEACPENKHTEAVHFVAKNPGWKFKEHEVKCEESVLKGTVGKLSRPQLITVTELTWKGCKLNGNECTVATKNGKWEIFWWALNSGGVAALSQVSITCGTTINCTVSPQAWKIEGATKAHDGKISVWLPGVLPKPVGTCPEPITWSASYESAAGKVYVLK